MNQNATLMIRWYLIIFLEFTFTLSIISCGSPYPESDGVYVYHSSGCDTLKQGILEGKQIQYMTIFQIKNLSGLAFHEIDSVIFKLPEADKDSISVLKLKYEKGEFIHGAGRMTKWRPELWIYDHDIPAHAKNIPGRKNILRIVFQERLSTGVYAICVKKQDSGFPEIHYYDFNIE